MDSKSCKSFASVTTACTRVGKKRISNVRTEQYDKSMRMTNKKQRTERPSSPCHSILSFAGSNIGRSPGTIDTMSECRIDQKCDEPFPLTKKNDLDQTPQNFKLWYERNLDFLTSKKKILDFDMSKLEIEYDYDTDEEQIYRAKKLLKNENFFAVEYYVKDDPFILVGNLALKDYSKQVKN